MRKLPGVLLCKFIVIFLFNCQVILPETIDGYAFLKDQTDHSDIQVKFDRTLPNPLTDTTTTDSGGYFSKAIEAGTYTITYTKTGYYSITVTNIQVMANLTMPDTTLYAVRSLIEVPKFLHDIQLAIDWAQNNDTILIDNGIYYENLICTNKCILLASNYLFTKDTNDIINTIIDGEYNGPVIRFNNVNDTTRGVTGLTVRRGSGQGYDDGAGIYCDDSDITLDHMIIEKDSGSFGSPSHGVYCYSSFIIIKNTLISDNYAGYNAGGIDGNYSVIKISDSQINNNVGYYGGGIRVMGGTAFIHNVIIRDNGAQEGGGIYGYNCTIYIDSSDISGNHGNSFWQTGGGGIYIEGNLQVSHTLICNNTSASKGGGIYIEGCSPVINNVVIAGNEATGNGSGIYITDPAHTDGPVIRNSIISNNIGNAGIYNDPTDYGAIDMQYNDVWDNEIANFYNCGITGTKIKKNANGDSCDYYFNIELYPLFTDAVNGDYHLQTNSPCIDAGDPSSLTDPDGTIADQGAYSIYQILDQPEADFSYSDSTSCSFPFTVVFSDLSTPGVTGGDIVQWSWNFGDVNTSAEQNPSHQYLDPGKYTVSLTVKNEISKESTKSLNNLIRISDLQAIISDSANISCGGYSDGSATIFASGGITPYLYDWDDPAETQTPQVNGLPANKYYHITVTDAIGCIARDSVILTEPEILTSFMSDTTNPTCYDYFLGSATVNVSGGTSPYSYLWNDPAQTITAQITGLHAYKYYHVTVTDATDCVLTDSIMLSQLDNIFSNIDIVSGISCWGMSDGSAVLSYSGGTPPYNILWDDPAASTTNLVTNLSGDIYYHVSITDETGCTIHDSIIITQPPLLVASITNVVNISYPGYSDGSATVTPEGGTPPYSYLWDDDLNTTDSVVNFLSAEIYYHVLITDAHGCTTMDSVFLTEPVVLSAGITYKSDVSCYGMHDGTATVTITSGNQPYTILWDDDAETQNKSVTNLEANRWYKVVVTDASMQFVSDSVWITQPDPLVITKEYSPKICKGTNNGSISIDVSGGVSPYMYSWSEGSFTQDLINLAPGKYYITVTDWNNCQITDTTKIDTFITPRVPEICMVTVNNENRIILVWEKAYNEGIAEYNIYREQSKNNYVKIGSVDFDSLSIFIDNSSMPEEISHFYKISVTDSCDNESGLSPYHKSIHLQTSMGLSKEINLFWDEYEGFDYYEYNIFRGSSLNQLYNIRTITSSAKSWTDKSPPAGQVYYRVEVVRPASCFPTRFKSEEYTSTFSNYDEETIVGFETLKENGLNIYPNPFTDQAIIQFPNPESEPYTLVVTDFSGRTVILKDNIRTGEVILERGNLPEGIYLLEMKGNVTFRSKFVIE